MAVMSGPHQLVDFNMTDAEELIQAMAATLRPAYNVNFPMINDCTFTMTHHYDSSL